jgi:replicative DNA helicase
MGKTALALGMARNVATQTGRPVVFFSMEMGTLELTKRLLAMEARVEATKLWTAKLNEDDWSRLSHAVGRLAEAQLYIDDNPHCTVMEMRAKARRLSLEHGLDLLMVDYLQLMRGRGRFESRNLEIADISRSLKELAKELKVPVVALSQLSRAPEQRGKDRRPQLADLRESGALEQDADVVLFLYRPEVYEPDNPELEGRAEAIIGKQRNGPIGTMDLIFVKNYATFSDRDVREERL